MIGILPITLDTPQNRKDMPKADFSSWTPMPELATVRLLFFSLILYVFLIHHFADFPFLQRIAAWAANEERPANGSLIELQTQGGVTEYIPVTFTATRGSKV